MRVTLALAILLVSPRAARADGWPTAVTERPLVLAPGMCQATLIGEANLSTRKTLEPVSAAPDLHCAVTPRLTAGLVHSARALSLADSGHGVCLTGDEHGCPRVYDDAAVDALYDVTGDRPVAVAGRARLVGKSFEPFKPSLRVGGLVRARAGFFALFADPHVSLALSAAELGNRDFAALPVAAMFQLGDHVALSLETGVRGDFKTFDETYVVPVGLAALVALSPSWDLGAAAGFARPLGPRNTIAQRHAALTVTYRFATAPPRPAAASYTAD